MLKLNARMAFESFRVFVLLRPSDRNHLSILIKDDWNCLRKTFDWIILSNVISIEIDWHIEKKLCPLKLIGRNFSTVFWFLGKMFALQIVTYSFHKNNNNKNTSSFSFADSLPLFDDFQMEFHGQYVNAEHQHIKFYSVYIYLNKFNRK